MKTLCKVCDGSGRMLMRIYESVAAPRSHAFRVHHHVEYELSLIISGCGRYSAKKEYPISEGDVFFYKNSEPHCITDIADGGMHILNVHLSPQYFRQLASLGRDENFGIGFLQTEFPSNKLSDFLSSEDAREVSTLLHKIHHELDEKREGFLLMVETCITSVLILIARSATARPAARVGTTHTSGELIFNSAAYIDLHFAESLSLSELAAAVNLERTYFSCLFKRIIGLSPWEYISIKRVEKAIELLRTTNMNVLDIAVTCGFNNTANFNKIFKRYAGSTPKSLRR